MSINIFNIMFYYKFISLQNPENNPEIHYQQTATEIWKEMKGKVDVFVAGEEVEEPFRELENF
ncbi:hypothetical protein ES708_08079 [subsurface metagenome]